MILIYMISTAAAITDTIIPVGQLTAPLSMPPMIPITVKRQTTLTEARINVSVFDEDKVSTNISSRERIKSIIVSILLRMADLRDIAEEPVFLFALLEEALIFLSCVGQTGIRRLRETS